MAFELGLHPDGEKLRSQIALLDLAKIDMAVRDRRVLAQVKVLVEEALRRVRVRINDQRGLMDGQGRINLRPRPLRGLGRFLMRMLGLRER